MPTENPPLQVHDEVAAALVDGRPVVALESNVIAHGLAYPDNVVTAFRAEDAVREAGAVPATIAVQDGRLVVGLNPDEIERLGSARGVARVSTRDLAPVLAGGGPGATSIAATLLAADLIGIDVVGSAGLGGVHRGAAATMDVSPDLTQLTRSRATLVCAGAKSILDLRLTLEWLETRSVPVVGLGTDDFPAFYCRSSGLPVPHRADDEARVARIVAMHRALGGTGSVLVAVPPDEAIGLDSAEVDRAVEAAAAAAERDGIRGGALTRHLLRAVDTATGGRADRANAAVVIGTAGAAGRVASACAELGAPVAVANGGAA